MTETRDTREMITRNTRRMTETGIERERKRKGTNTGRKTNRMTRGKMKRNG